MARVTDPAARMVWTRSRSLRQSPLMLIGTSPTPAMYSMLNWPGRKAKGWPSTAAICQVNTPGTSRLARVMRNRRGVIGSAGRSAGWIREPSMSALRGSVLREWLGGQFDDAQAVVGEALGHHRQEALEDLVAQD